MTRATGRPCRLANTATATSAKTVQTDVGAIRLAVPRDRAGSFEPLVVPKHARRVGGFDDGDLVSLYAKGLTTGEIQAHLAEVYGAEVSRDLISKVTDAVNERAGGVAEPAAGPGLPGPVRSTPCMSRSATGRWRTGRSTSRSGYHWTASGTCSACGPGPAGRAPRRGWPTSPSCKNRGVADVCIVCVRRAEGPARGHRARPGRRHPSRPASSTWCAHRCGSPAARDWQPITPGPPRDLHRADRRGRGRPVRRVRRRPGAAKYPAIIRTVGGRWEQFTPFLAFAVEIRTVIYTTNMIESLNARFRQAIRRRGHFPNEQAALKVLYLVIRSPDQEQDQRDRHTSRLERGHPRTDHVLRRQDHPELMKSPPRPRKFGRSLVSRGQGGDPPARAAAS